VIDLPAIAETARSDTFRERYYGPGYVYIAGSLSHRVLKIGTTVNIRNQEKRLQRTKYGNIDNWVILYYVWVSEGGKIEHDARRILRRYRELRMYDKEGHRQKGREIVNCRFGITDQVDPWRTVSLAANAPSFPLCYL
jgi:hypothetical protein